jgi:hypothetical protein
VRGEEPLATEAGILSGAMFAAGIPNSAGNTNYQDTASDLAFRAITDPAFAPGPLEIGPVAQLTEFPVFSVRGQTGGLNMDGPNPAYDALTMHTFQNADNTVQPNTPRASAYHEQVAFTCGGSAGANNRYSDFRSSGCTSCHMRYSLDGRSYISDPNVVKNEPADVDQIDDPKRPHVKRHMITSRARTLTTGEFVQGMDDYTCAGCHQGSNRTVMQYWGIRLDQNQDVRRNVQYPNQPARYTTTRFDTRLFDPVVNNQTFNGRNFNQHLLTEDYDNDFRDDTPPDVHYESGLGCIDGHGSHDVHGGTVGDTASQRIYSRQEQAVAITCESCHGGIDNYAASAPCTDYDGDVEDCGVDAKGNPLRNVTRGPDGELYLTSRLTGQVHYIKQTRDTVDGTSGKLHPFTNELIYSSAASYAMGRFGDGDDTNGSGPTQTNPAMVSANFSHTNNMSCVSCHASWTNSCIGCHLKGKFDNGNNFSNVTGDRIVFEEENADFVYQTPVPFQLGVNAHNKITQMAPNTETFFQYIDFKDDVSQIFSFTDRKGKGNNPGAGGSGPLGALSHNVMMPHSIRGKVTTTNEGPRDCVACHLTTGGLTFHATEWTNFKAAYNAEQYQNLDYGVLQDHIGQNSGNQINSPVWVHQVAGLGTGLFLFDDQGCPTNPLDNDNNRFGCEGTAPATSGIRSSHRRRHLTSTASSKRTVQRIARTTTRCSTRHQRRFYVTVPAPIRRCPAHSVRPSSTG